MEYPTIPSRQYALYTIYKGCDAKRFEFSGCTRTEEEARALAPKLMKGDNVFDIRIYTCRVYGNTNQLWIELCNIEEDLLRWGCRPY